MQPRLTGLGRRKVFPLASISSCAQLPAIAQINFRGIRQLSADISFRIAIMRRVFVLVGAAKVAELVDAQDLGSCGETRESSSLSFRTNIHP